MKSTLQVYEYKIDSIDCTFFRIFEDESQIFPVFPRPRSMWSKVAGISFHTQVKKVSIPETGDVASRDGFMECSCEGQDWWSQDGSADGKSGHVMCQETEFLILCIISIGTSSTDH